VNDYIGYVIFDSNFEGGAGLTDLFVGGLGWEQFKGLFSEVGKVGEDMGGMIKGFVGEKLTVERKGIEAVAKRNIGKDSYPDKSELKAVKSKLQRVFKSFYGKQRAQKMLEFQMGVLRGWMDALTSDEFGSTFKSKEQFPDDLWTETKKISSDEKVKAIKEQSLKKVAKKLGLPESDKLNSWRTKFFKLLKKESGWVESASRIRALRRLTKKFKKNPKKTQI
jgi:hypothetical protein